MFFDRFKNKQPSYQEHKDISPPVVQILQAMADDPRRFSVLYKYENCYQLVKIKDKKTKIAITGHSFMGGPWIINATWATADEKLAMIDAGRALLEARKQIVNDAKRARILRLYRDQDTAGQL